MPVGPRGQKRPADPVGCAVMIGRLATKQIDEDYVEKKVDDPASERGLARARALTKKRRSEIARQAALARWRQT